MSEETEPNTIERRSALKKLGAGAAIAWSAPAVASFATPAAAGTPGVATCDTCTAEDCGTPGCGTFNFLGGPSSCFCSSGPLGCQKVFFPSLDCGFYDPCGPDGSCPSGHRCVTTCCCDAFCAPACPDDNPRAVGQSRPPGAR